MPKLLCKCGETLMLHEIPCPIEFQLISETAIDENWETLRAESLRNLAHEVVKCEACGRLHVFWKQAGSDDRYVSYAPEDE